MKKKTHLISNVISNNIAMALEKKEAVHIYI